MKNRSNPEMCVPIPVVLKQEFAREEEQRLKAFFHLGVAQDDQRIISVVFQCIV